MEEIKRNDDPFYSAVIFKDEEERLHIYNPSISLAEFIEIQEMKKEHTL